MKVVIAEKDARMAELQKDLRAQMTGIEKVEAQRREALEREQAAILANLQDAATDMQQQILKFHSAHRFSRHCLVVCVILAGRPLYTVGRLQGAIDAWRQAWGGRSSGFRVISRVANALHRLRVVHRCIVGWRETMIKAKAADRDRRAKMQDRAFLRPMSGANDVEPVEPEDPFKSPKMVGSHTSHRVARI